MLKRIWCCFLMKSHDNHDTECHIDERGHSGWCAVQPRLLATLKRLVTHDCILPHGWTSDVVITSHIRELHHTGGWGVTLHKCHHCPLCVFVEVKCAGVVEKNCAGCPSGQTARVASLQIDALAVLGERGLELRHHRRHGGSCILYSYAHASDIFTWSCQYSSQKLCCSVWYVNIQCTYMI